MVQIIQGNEQYKRRPSFAQSILGGLVEGIPGAIQQYQQGRERQSQQQALKRTFGNQIVGLPPDIQKQFVQAALEGGLQSQKMANELKGNKSQIQAIARERGLPESATEGFNDPKVFEQVTRPTKPTKGEREITPEQLKRIQKVRTSPGYDEASPTQKYQMLTDEGVSMENATAEANISAEEFKEGKAGEREFKKERMDIHKESSKYDEELISNTKVAKKQIDTIKDISKALESGNISAGSWTNIFKGFGKLGEQISKSIINKDEATLQASIPALLEGWKDVFGVRLSDADLKVLQDKLPDIGKNPAANKAILKIMEKYADQTLLRSKIAAQIKKENDGWRPLGYADLIEERYDQMIKPVNVRDPHTGRVIPIPAYQVSAAIEDGGEIVNE